MGDIHLASSSVKLRLATLQAGDKLEPCAFLDVRLRLCSELGNESI